MNDPTEAVPNFNDRMLAESALTGTDLTQVLDIIIQYDWNLFIIASVKWHKKIGRAHV